ncbi:MAG TPA: hypothetical protein VD793_04340, partial [Gemmatimonadales bacterium]|nr:hypothetical protein [Gemmatimonadales bacterium]
SLQAVPETVLVVGKPGRIARVYASAPHPIVADLVAERESRSRAIYAGAIGDSLDIRWDGRAAEDQAPLTGHLTLRVASWSPAGRESVVKLVLQVTSVMPDTLAHPPPPLEPDSGVVAQAREPRGTWPAVRALVVGAFGSAAAVALARVFPDEPASGNGPYVVAGALGLMGIVGFVAQRPTSLSADHGLPDQVRAWRRQVAEIRRLNEERRQIVRLKVVPLPAAGS